MLTGLAVAGIGLALLGMLFPALGMAMCGCLPCCMAGACCGLAAAGAAGTANNTNSNNQQQYNGGPAQGGANNNKHDQRYRSDPSQGDYYAAESAPRAGSSSQEFLKFEAAAQRAKQEVESSSTAQKQQPYVEPLAQPYSGQYSTSYVDRTTGVQHNATLNLSFTPDFYGTGFKLSGEGHDIDGQTAIEDGHVNCDGTAWWREFTISGDVGLKVLSRGKFDFEQKSFNGTWLASTMEHGAYIIFRAAGSGEEALMMQPQPYVPIVATAGNSNIPVVSASQVVTISGIRDFKIPLVSATVVSTGSTSVAATTTASPSAYAYVPPANTGTPTVYVP
jgi:hypothetical protein